MADENAGGGGNFLDDLAAKAKEVGEQVKEFAEDAFDNVKEFASDAGDNIKDLAADAGDNLKGFADDAKEKGQQAFEGLKDKLDGDSTN
ncbi:MAG: hypothetical protein QM582_12985 [Micropruina sp.]|uniref:hypothetical protein n=1 Tax=Micropruina sp. TaxID=2737536 RepID=UPI0039E28041